MTTQTALGCALVLGLLLTVRPLRADAGSEPLTLTHVLRSVAARHPVILADRATVDAAHGEARATRGEFEPSVTVQARAAASGYYDGRRVDVVVEQPTPLFGATLYSGYRLTRGKIAPYYGEQRTLDRGELRAGARVPLLQERALDGRRAALRTADAHAEATSARYAERLLELDRAAAQAYFAWVAAGQKLRIAEALVALAEARATQLDELVALGATAALEAVDNRRAILDRRRQQVVARRALEGAAIDLSLFLRAEDGAPRVVGREALPEDLTAPTTTANSTDAAERRALSLHPDLRAEAALVRMAHVEHALAQARVAPRLDVLAEISRDLGSADPQLVAQLGPTVVEVGATLSLPISLLRARGKRDAARAKLESAREKARYAADAVRAEVRDAHSQLAAAHERISLAEAARAVAHEVAAGERERLTLGGSTVLFVNLREQQAADAESALVDAITEAHYAAARARIAEGSTPEVM